MISIEELKAHFKNAKSVRCLRSKIVIDVTGFDAYKYNEESNSYTSSGGMLLFWKDGVFAEIKEEVNSDCGCNS